MAEGICWYKATDAGETEIALLIHLEPNHYGSGFIRAQTVEVHAQSHSIRNYGTSSWDDNCGWADFGAYAYLSKDVNYLPTTADAEYREVFSIDARGLAAKAKVMTKVNKSLDKQTAKLGTTDSMGESIRRFAEACGAKHIITRRPTPARYGNYDDDRDNYLWHTLPEGKARVNGMVREFYQEHGSENAKALVGR